MSVGAESRELWGRRPLDGEFWGMPSPIKGELEDLPNSQFVGRVS